MKTIITYITTFLVAILLVGIYAMILGFPVKWLWNWIMPDFGVCTIGYWKAVGILLLSGLIFRSTVNIKQ